MRILMFGYLSSEFIKDNWLTPMKNLYDVTYVDISVITAYDPPLFIEEYLYNIIREQNFDYFFFYTDTSMHLLSDEFFDNNRKKGIKNVAFHADDQPDKWFNINSVHDNKFDYIITHSKLAHELRVNKNKAISLYMHWGYNPDIFKKLENFKKNIDVVFIGSNHINPSVDHDDTYSESRYCNDGKKRRDEIVCVYNFCKENNYDFKLYGYNWENDEVLKECFQGCLTLDEMIEVYNKSKIVINLGYIASDDANDDRFQTKLRHFEVAGCGSFQLTNRNYELMEIFSDDELIYYDNFEDLTKKIHYYLNNDELRENIASKMHKKALETCTMTYLISKTFKEIAGNNYKEFTIKKIDIEQIFFKELPEFQDFKYAISEDLQNSKCKYVHLICGAFDIVDINYTSISTFLKKDYDIIKVVSTFEVAKYDVLFNFHRNKLTNNIIKLNCNINLSLYSKHIQDMILRSFMGFNNFDNTFTPYINLIIKKEVVYNVIESIANQEDLIEKYKVITKPYVVNDVNYNGNITLPFIDIYPFNKLINNVLKQCEYDNLSVMIYGINGCMCSRVVESVKLYPNIDFKGFIDRDLKGNFFEIIYSNNIKKTFPVYNLQDLNDLDIDVIFISADAANKQIYDSIKHMSPSTSVFQVNNLSSPIWDFYK